jgi:hypothetical protein
MRAAILSMALTGIAAPAAVRIETAPTGNSPASTLIFADSELLLLDDDERTYYRITPAALEELSGAMPPALAGLRNSPFDTMSQLKDFPYVQEPTSTAACYGKSCCRPLRRATLPRAISKCPRAIPSKA